jgi:hypothetical protein
MNILLWVLQGGLAFYYLMGGIYQAKNHKIFDKGKASMKPVWIGLGVLQAVLALALLLPQACAAAAIGLAVETLFSSVVLLKMRKFSALAWILLPAALALFVAYGRLMLVPF